MKTAFIKSSPTLHECPPTEHIEVAFVGRSNVGKSSLINMLVQKKDLTKVSKKPGKTRLINHFLVDDHWHLVDLPGYGYAKASVSQKTERVNNMYEYLTKRKQLKYTFLLLDSKLPPQGIDQDFVEELYAENIPFAVVFTKTDKVSQKIAHQNFTKRQAIFDQINHKPPIIFKTSSLKKRGRNDILDFIEELVEYCEEG